MSTAGLLVRLLSPLTLSGLNTDHAALRKPDINIKTVVRHLCPDCGAEHDDRAGAVQCCAKDRAQGRPIRGGSGVHCPVCDGWCKDSYEAADCCLWKDLTPASRILIASAHEGGAAWADAIAAHGAKA